MPFTVHSEDRGRGGERRPAARLLAPLVLALLLAPAPAHAGEKWEQVTREDGITVTKRDVPGRGFPTFRGVGLVAAHVYDVLAVIGDVPAYPEWQVNCKMARELKKLNEMEYLVYSRIGAPWPVSDRDAVYHATVHAKMTDKLIVEVRFNAVKTELQPPVKGVVRMEKMRGFFRLTALGPRSTLMEYHVDGDPGGLLPTWLAKLATRKVPLDTIRNMRKRVVVTRGRYDERIKRWKAMEPALRQ